MKQKLTTQAIKSLTPAEKPYEARDTEIKGFLLRVQPSGVMTYYLEYRNPTGKRTRLKIGLSSNMSAAQARDEAKVQAGVVARGGDPQADKKVAKIQGERDSKRTLRAFLDKAYQPWAESHQKRAKENLRNIETQFDEFMTRKLDDINNWVIEKWRTKRLKSGVTPVTVNRYISSLRSVLSKAVEWGVIQHHPLARLKPIPVDHAPKVRYLEPDEEKRLRKALTEREIKIKTERISANKWRKDRSYPELESLDNKSFVDHLQPMVLLAMNTGLRRGELFSLEWEHVDLKGAILTVHGAKAKSRRTRHVPLNDEALNILNQWRNASESKTLVFPNKDGLPFNNIKRAWEGLLKAAGVTKFRFHDLRHTFASKLVMAGVDLNTVRELLGHSDIQMTLRYAHLGPEHKAEAVSRLTRKA